MAKIEGLTINQTTYDLPSGLKGVIAVLMYVGNSDPKKVLDFAVDQYVGNEGCNELIDAHLDNPWMRVVISDINNMNQEIFDPELHKMSKAVSGVK